MAEYLDRDRHMNRKPLPTHAREAADRKGPLKRCGHAPDYRCACAAHEEPEQHPDLVDELTMNPGYRLARAYGRELHGDEDIESGASPRHPSKVRHTHRWTTGSEGHEQCVTCGASKL